MFKYLKVGFLPLISLLIIGCSPQAEAIDVSNHKVAESHLNMKDVSDIKNLIQEPS